MSDPRVQKHCLNNLDIIFDLFLFNQYWYNLPETTLRANGIIYHIFKPNNFRDVQNLNRNKDSENMTLNDFKLVCTLLTTTCWDKNHQPLNVDMTKDKNKGTYRLGLNTLSIPDTNPF